MRQRCAEDRHRTGLTTAAALLAACTIVSFCSCGGGGAYTPTSPVVTPPPAPVRTVVAQGGYSLYAPASGLTSFLYSQFTTTRTGEIEATVDWTNAGDELWMYISEGVCTADQFETDDCPGPDCPCKFSVASEVASPKPRVLNIPNASAGTRTLIIWSLQAMADDLRYQVVLTTTGVAKAAATTARPNGTTIEEGRKRVASDLRQ